MEWNYVNTTTAPPASGQLRMNNSAQHSPTLMYVHKTSADGVDATNVLAQAAEEDTIYLQDKDDSTKWQTYRVTGAPADNVTHMTYPIEWIEGAGTIPQQRIILVVQNAVEPPVEPPVEPGILPRMTLRQFYAAHAMNGLLASAATLANLKDRSEWAFRVADQMIKFEADEAADIPTPLVGTPGRKRR